MEQFLHMAFRTTLETDFSVLNIIVVSRSRMQFQYFVVFFFMISVFQASATEITCDKNIHENCETNDIYDEFILRKFEFLENGSFVTHCADYLENINCQREYIRICLPKGIRQYEVLTGGLRTMLSDLCNETSPFRQAHDLYSPCLRNNTDQLEDCIVVSIAGALGTSRHGRATDLTIEEVMVRFCKLFALFKVCSRQKIEEVCGDAASEHFQSILDQSLGNLSNRYCPPRMSSNNID